MPGKREGTLVYDFSKFVLFIFYRVFFRVKAYSVEEVLPSSDPRGVILASNHASFLDPPAIGVCVPRRVTYLAKDYLFGKFIVGWILKSIGAFRIKSRVGDFRGIRDLIGLLKEGRCVVIFPEGTRSADGRLKEPESGVGFIAVKSGCAVVPIYIEGSYEAFPKGARWFKPYPIRLYFGKAFVPAEDRLLMARQDVYKAVSAEIMARITDLKTA